jgi:S-adenosylmethionine hydrolase
MAGGILTLTTDFGLSDPFVGVMKGVILGIAPDAKIVDLTHNIPPQNILAGALALEAACRYFPPGTIHLAVVDPGVGSDRAAVAIQTQQAYFVGPDNGLFTLVVPPDSTYRAVRLTNPDYHLHPVSATFHGRDLFAPVAAHLLSGVPLEAFGEPHFDLVRLSLPQPILRDSSLELHILHADHFGNLITDLTRDAYLSWRADADERHVSLMIGATESVRLLRTYAQAQPGELFACFGSAGRLEVAVRNGSAALHTGLSEGASILIKKV